MPEWFRYILNGIPILKNTISGMIHLDEHKGFGNIEFKK